MESWTNISGFEEFYEVSTEGRVRSKPRTSWRFGKWITYPGRILKGASNGRQYWVVTLVDEAGRRHNRIVHRLVAEHFLPLDSTRTHVDHINGCRMDNRVSNLRWCTPRENSQNHERHRKGKLCGVTYFKATGRWRAQASINGSTKTHVGYFDTPEEAHAAYLEATRTA